MTIGSLFAGVGGFDLAFERAGFETRWAVEIDDRARSVYARHFPNAQLFTDVRNVGAYNLEPVDVIVGGFPCQDLSVAGKRAGLDGERSGLFYELSRIVAELSPDWLCLENVPGLLSSNGGRDMGAVVGTLGELGYGVCWRVLDAQHFGVPQRRRRVFIVGHSGGRCPAEVLFEPESVCGHPAAGEEAWGGTAGTAGSGFTASSHVGYRHGCGTLRANGGDVGGGSDTLIDRCLSTSNQRIDAETETFVVANSITASAGHHGYSSPRGDGSDNLVFEPAVGFTWQASSPNPVTDGAPTLRVGADGSAVAYGWNGDPTPKFGTECSPTLRAQQGGEGTGVVCYDARGNGDGANAAVTGDHNNRVTDYTTILHTPMTVRRLMPVECERLQGFPDGWTEGQADSSRYKQMGNAVAVPVVEWIARRMRKEMER